MAFVFPLQALLRVREIHETTERQSLQAIAAQAAATRAEIEALDRLAEQAWRELSRDSLAGVSGAELQFHLGRESSRQGQRQFLANRLQELETRRQAQQLCYRHARQQREILSTLRDQQLAAYELEQSRRQQREIDELFLMRRPVLPRQF